MENNEEINPLLNIPYSIEDDYEDSKQKESLMNAIRCLTYYYKNMDKPMLDCIKVFVLQNNIVIPNDLLVELGFTNSNLDVEKTKTYYLKKFRTNVNHSKLAYFTSRYSIFLSTIKYLTLKIYNNDYNYLKDNFIYIQKKYTSFDDSYSLFTNTVKSMNNMELLALKVLYLGKDNDIKQERQTVQNHYNRMRSFYIASLIDKCISNFDEKDLTVKMWHSVINDRFSNPYNYIIFKNIIRKPIFNKMYGDLTEEDRFVMDGLINNYTQKNYRIPSSSYYSILGMCKHFNDSKVL